MVSHTQRNSVIPTYWYNAMAYYPELFEPYIDPKTNEVVSTELLEDIFTPSLIEQDLDVINKRIPIPNELLELYQLWRPTPLVRAKKLEEYLDTKCKIFFKYEGASPIGSHKANSAIAQAYYCKKDGICEVVAETGAGQWGSAISMASSFFSLQSKVFMVKNSFNSKPARRTMMQTFGSEVVSSPSEETDVGRNVLRESPDFGGSLGVAIGEAIEYASKRKSTVYTMGSAFNFVCLHQTIIGNELKQQLTDNKITPDHIISCIGGGSSFAGICLPFLPDKEKNKNLELIAVESEAVPSVTKGIFAYDYGDSAELTPLAKMYTLGHKFAPPVIHAGGLRYHGLSPIVSKMVTLGYAKAEAYSQIDIFRAAEIFAKCEGYIPAPEAAHSVKSAIETALKFRNHNNTIVFCLTGHGFFDLAGYDLYNNQKMKDSSIPQKAIAESISEVKQLNKNLRELPPNSPSSKNETVPNNSKNFTEWWDNHFETQNSPSLYKNQKIEPEKNHSEATNKILTAVNVEQAYEQGRKTISVANNCVITPLAMDLLRKYNITTRK